MPANHRRAKPSQFGRLLLRCVYDTAHDKPRPLGLRALPVVDAVSPVKADESAPADELRPRRGPLADSVVLLWALGRLITAPVCQCVAHQPEAQAQGIFRHSDILWHNAESTAADPFAGASS